MAPPPIQPSQPQYLPPRPVQPQPRPHPAVQPANPGNHNNNQQPSYRPHQGRGENDNGSDDDETDEDGGSSTSNPIGERDYFPPPNIIGVLEDEEATTILSLLEQADLLEALEGRGPFTLFAPTNEAFSKLDQSVIRRLTDDRDLLADVLKYHVVPEGKIFSKVIKDDLTADTLLEDEDTGRPVTVRFNKNEENGVITVNGAEIDLTKVDQRASNGVIHFLSDVIFPVPAGSVFDTLDDDDRFSTLVRALEVADLADALDSRRGGSVTVFAPTDDAFADIPRAALNELLDDPDALRDLLLKHVVKGTKLSPALAFVDLEAESGDTIEVRTRKGRVFVNEAQLIDGDIIGLNGAIQVIDKVLL